MHIHNKSPSDRGFCVTFFKFTSDFFSTWKFKLEIRIAACGFHIWLERFFFRALITCTTHDTQSSQIALKKEQELNCIKRQQLWLMVWLWLRCQGWWRIKNKYSKKQSSLRSWTETATNTALRHFSVCGIERAWVCAEFIVYLHKISVANSSWSSRFLALLATVLLSRTNIEAWTLIEGGDDDDGSLL